MKTADRAYLAGLIDGEGCIGLRGRSDTYTNCALEICMTDRISLDWAHQITKVGRVYASKESRGNRRTPYKWMVGGVDNIEQVIRGIYPFLKVKKAEALVFLVYANMFKTKTTSGKRVHIEAETKLKDIMRKLKDRKIPYQEALDLCLYLRQALEEQND